MTSETSPEKDRYLPLGTVLYGKLAKLDTELISFLLMLLLCCQPLYSFVFRSDSLQALTALYHSKATVIRLIGFLGLLNAGADFYRRCYLFGRRAALKALFGNIWTGLMAIVLVIAFVSCFTSRYVYVSFNGDAYRYEGFVSYVAYAGIFASASLLRSERRRETVLRTFVFCSVPVALMTLLKELTGSDIIIYAGNRVAPYSGTFINPNHYGYYLCLAIAVSLGLYIKHDRWYMKLLFGTVFALNTLLLLLNGSYGPYLAALAGIVLAAVLYAVRGGIRSIWTAVFPVAAFVLLSIFVRNGAVFGDIAKTSGEFVKIMGSIGEGIGSGDVEGAVEGVNGGSGRFSLWVATVKAILDNPVLGCGTDCIHRVLPDYGGTLDMPHNEYLQLTANCGIPAGLLWITALVWFFVRNMRCLKKITPATLVSGIAVFVYAVSAFVGVGMTVTTCYLFLFLGLTNSYHSAERVRELAITHTGTGLR